MTDRQQQMIDFAQGLVLQRFAEARTNIDAFKTELFKKLDGMEAQLVLNYSHNAKMPSASTHATVHNGLDLRLFIVQCTQLYSQGNFARLPKQYFP